MKPGDFFLGVMDFLAILLPGSLATWLVAQYIPESTLRSALVFKVLGQSEPDQVVVGITVFLSSYLLGHFVFMAGSKLDSSYDRWRERVHAKAVDTAYNATRNLQKRLTPDLIEFSTLKWAKAYVQVKSAQARVEIDRLEAEQKFFRSLVVISSLFAAHLLLRERSLVAGAIALVMAVLSYRRYLQRRWTMTELIFGTAVIVGATSGTKTDEGQFTKSTAE